MQMINHSTMQGIEWNIHEVSALTNLKTNNIYWIAATRRVHFNNID